MLDQLVIAACGIASVWASQDRRHNVRRWACIFGIAGQPAWFYASWQAAQWGILTLSLVYTVGWIRGLWTHWVRP